MLSRIVVASAVAVVLSIAALAPSAHIAHGALIVNTTISSSIIDGRGVAIAVAPFACGIDSTVWCEVADWSAAS